MGSESFRYSFSEGAAIETVDDVCVLIPAYNPDGALPALVDSLIKIGFMDIIVVNDGSRNELGGIFDGLSKTGRCHVIGHAVNLGKGRAIKTGLNYFRTNFPRSAGVVTADADGQHAPEDIRRVAVRMKKDPGSVILGAREFKGVPARSLVGNVMTRYMFLLFVGKMLSDTQTGLRGVPADLVPAFLGVKGDRYEYELAMLIECKLRGIDIVEEKISTIYVDGNKGSHFNPLIDSAKIYFLFIKFSFSSIFASLVDFIVFAAVYSASLSIPAGIAAARLVSGNLNLFINKTAVFSHRGDVLKSIAKYYLLMAVLGATSAVGIKASSELMGMNVYVSKVAVETVLFLASFAVQREMVFRNAPSGGGRNG